MWRKSGLTRDGTGRLNLSPETQFSGANGDRDIFIFLVQPTTTRIGNTVPIDGQSAIYNMMTMYGHTYSKSMDQPGKVTIPARGQLNRKNEYFPLSAFFVPENFCSRETGSAVPSRVSLLISI